MRKFTSILFAFFMVAVMVACTAAPIAPTAVSSPTVVAPTTYDWKSLQGGKPFRLIATNVEVPVVKIMGQGFMQACRDYGLDCVIMGVQGNDIAGSVTLTEQSVALGSSGMEVAIYDKAWYAPTAKAIAAGIPVVEIHFPIKQDVFPGLKAWVAPDNVGYGVNAADAMGDKIACKGKVAITESSLNDGENAVAAAFAGEMAKKCANVSVLPVQLETTDPAKSLSVASSIIQANPDLTGAFSTTGGGATAWGQAAQGQGKAKGAITIIGMDFTRQNMDLVKSGDVYALVAQPVYAEFYQGVIDLLLVKLGQPVPYENVLPSPLIYAKDLAPYYHIVDLADQAK
jgi:ribose transport system substrate-binding protein